MMIDQPIVDIIIIMLLVLDSFYNNAIMVILTLRWDTSEPGSVGIGGGWYNPPP